MSANTTQTGRFVKSYFTPWTTFVLIFTMAAIGLIVAGVLTKQLATRHYDQTGFRTIDAVHATADPSAVATASRAAAPTIAQMLSALLRELGKQAIDQPGHLLIAALPIVLSRQLTGVPWYGWPVVPLLAYREWLQWPSNRWWDPPLDWAVLALGVILATWAVRSLPRIRRPWWSPRLAPTRASAGPHQ